MTIAEGMLCIMLLAIDVVCWLIAKEYARACEKHLAVLRELNASQKQLLELVKAVPGEATDAQ